MVALQERFPLLLYIGLSFCFVKGFVVRYNPSATSSSPHTNLHPVPSYSQRNVGNRYYLSSQTTPEVGKTSLSPEEEIGALGASAKIRKMAFGLCTMLLEKVVTKAIVEDKDGSESKINLDAMQRLVSALEMTKESDSKVPSTSSLSLTESQNAENQIGVESEETETNSSLPMNDSVESAPTASNAVWNFPALEIIESNLEPLRPSSVPKRMKEISEQKKIKQQQASGVEDLPLVPESTVYMKDNSVYTWNKKPSDLIFDSNEAWDLESILTSVVEEEEVLMNQKNSDVAQIQSKVIGIEKYPAATTSTNTFDDTQNDVQDHLLNLQEEQKSQELFRRKLLQKRLELEHKTQSRIMEESKEHITAPQQVKAEGSVDTLIEAVLHTSEQSFRRQLLRAKLDIDARAERIQRERSKEQLHRSLLKTKLKLELQSQKMSRQMSSEIFQRRLLKARLEIDARSKMIQAEERIVSNAEPKTTGLKEVPFGLVETKISEELFHRSLLRERLEQDLLNKAKKEEKANENQPSRLKAAGEASPPSVVSEDRKSKKLYHKRLSTTQIEDTEKGDSVKLKNQKDPTSERIPDSVSTGVIDCVNTDCKVDNDSEDEPNCSVKGWVSSLPTTSQERYAREAKVSHSFVQSEFKPAWWSKNDHFQTIIGTLFRKETMYSRGDQDMSTLLRLAGFDGEATSDDLSVSQKLDEFQWDRRTRVETNDGDLFVVDWRDADVPDEEISGKNDENPICLICHGLESCSDSEIARELAIACNEKNIDAACINFRGCADGGEECSLTARAYHLGFTDDLMHQINEINSKHPTKRIYLSGFSLGAGVVTKLLADLGEDAYRYNICGAAVNAVPFDTRQYHTNLNEAGFTKTIYGDRLLASMQRRSKQQFDACPGIFPFERSEIDKCKTIMDLENLLIAPIFGFDDAMDYYDKVKTIDKLHNVCVPELVVQARDDPFFAGLELPANDPNTPLRIQYTDEGGHCGFIFHQLDANEERPSTSWMPTQLARFLAHLEENREPSADIPPAVRHEGNPIEIEDDVFAVASNA
ncbi:unnamed protein product [Pseudo-nitzschia multistriata]|uniref:Serine aminopeptidase S33 domain-containing protein n=1 Tax=Pseudo-nitzschia multistriata TaxID=183589 RepID=A0A448Z2G6_9STRA|nr:unnamed protein product [Pseudo-nitzschia multistriata]